MPQQFKDDTVLNAPPSADALVDVIPIQSGQPAATPSRRVMGGVIVAVVAILGLGLWQLSHNVFLPFHPDEELLKVDFSYLNQSSDNPEVLRQSDTDGDGLNDYDEQTIYLTSIYLSDTDSDGISDTAEIAKGTDPRCPEGKDCTILKEYYNQPASQAETQVATLLGNAGISTDTNQTAAEFTASLSPLHALVAQENIDPTELRTLLIANGVSSADLDQVSDTDLIAMIRQLQGQTIPAAAATTTSTATASTDTTATAPAAITTTLGASLTADQKAAFTQMIQGMSSTELKKLLIDSGVSKTLVEGKDDATLREFLLQTFDIAQE